MKELIAYLESLDGSIIITGSQHDRTWELDYNEIPKTAKEFYAIVEKAPWYILKGYGFGKWDKISGSIKENNDRPETKVIAIPVLNSDEPFAVDLSRKKDVPSELKGEDQWILLLPAEWYDIIPEGFPLTDISGQKEVFQKGVTDDDRRFGCLAYGILRPVSEIDE